MNNLLTLLNGYIKKTEDECNSVKKLSKIWKIYFCFFIGLNLWLLPTSTFALDTLWNKTLSESDCSGNAADCDWFNDTNWNNNQPNANINQTTINTGGTTIISGNREANGGQTLVLDDLPGVSDNFSKVILQNGSLVSGSVNIISATGFIQNGGTNTVTNTLTINGFGSPSYALNDGILIANNIHLVDGNFNQQGGLVFGNVQTDPGTQFVINGRGFEGDIINNGQILFEGINDQILKSNISGSGNLLLNTLGKVTLTGNNTYNGGTFIENGTLNVSSESSLGTGDLSITGGTLQISGTSFNSLSRNIVVSQDSFGIDIVDKGNIFKINQDLSVLETTCEVEHTCSGFTIGGLGTLVLSGNNTYFGGTNLNSGTLSVSSESNLGQITSTLNFNGGILQITGTNFNSTSRTINWGAGGGGFDIADSSNIFRLNQNIGPGGNLIKRGGGTLVLNGTNTYTGGTTVDAGNLQVGDDTHLDARIGGPVTVNSTGILSGHGTITGDVFNNGTLSPGGSIGTLNVQGNVRFTPNSLFNVEINPNQASLLNVSGFASLNNANVSILADPGTYAPRTYTILNAAGGVRGTFANLNLTNPISNPSLALLTPTLQFLPNRVDLSLSQVVDPMGELPHVDRHLARERNRIVSGRLNTPLGINCAENRFGFWARGLGMLSYADASGNAPKYEGGTGGAIMGFDHQFGEYLSLGIAGFTTNTDVTTFQLGNNKSNSDNAGASLYGVLTTGPWQFKTVLSYDNSSYSAQRGISSSVVQRSAQSKTHANQISNYNELSYAFKRGNLSLQPLAGMSLGWLRQNGFSEKGGVVGQNLSVDGRTLYSLDTFIGLKVRESVDINSLLKAQFELHALYDHDFSSLKESSLGRFDNGAVGLVKTADRLDQRDAGIIGASFSLLTADSLNFYLDYNGEIRSGQNSHFFNAGIRYVW